VPDMPWNPCAQTSAIAAMARTTPTERMARFRSPGGWRTSLRPKREWKMTAKPIYLVGFVALITFVVVVLSCTPGVV
jgi:hypothetical protein